MSPVLVRSVFTSRRRRFRRSAAVLWVSLAALALPRAQAGAQVSSASAAALGMGENFTAAARGVDAVAWNPSVLALPRDRGASLVMFTIRGSSGLGPVGLSDLADWSNTLVPDGVKQEWLDRITAGGGQQGSGGGEVTWLALTAGRFALHASTAARALADVSPGVAELVLFGNAGPAGQPQRMDLSGSRLDVFAYSAVGASYGHELQVDGMQAAIGVTGKFVMGHAMARGDQSTGATTTDPVSVSADFPVVHSDVENGRYHPNNGSGFGVDVGGTIMNGPWTFAAVIQNLVNTFTWNTSRLAYRPLVVSFDRNSANARVQAVPLISAPVEVQDRIAGLGFSPTFAAGVAWEYAPDLLFTADMRFTSADGLLTGPAQHVGAGGEYLLTDALPVRFGAALISMGDGALGWQAGGGFGLGLGPWSMSLSALRRDSGRFGTSTVIMLSLFGSGR